jgi:hypothetical protein
MGDGAYTDEELLDAKRLFLTNTRKHADAEL